MTTLYHIWTGLPWAWRIDPGTNAEREHPRQMLELVPEAALLVADAGFTGYDLWADMIARRLSSLVRVGSNVRLLTDQGLEIQRKRDAVWLWPRDHRHQPPMKLRLIRVKGTEGSKSDVYLITNVLEAERPSDEVAAFLCQMRWDVEGFYRSYKQTPDQRKLRSDAPDQAQWEIYWGLTGLPCQG